MQYLECRTHDGVCVINFLVNVLSEEENIEAVAHELFQLVEQSNEDTPKFVLDLSNLEFATSTLLAKMITLHRRVHRVGGVLVVCGAKGVVEELLHGSRLASYFHTAHNATDAIETAHAEA